MLSLNKKNGLGFCCNWGIKETFGRAIHLKIIFSPSLKIYKKHIYVRKHRF